MNIGFIGLGVMGRPMAEHLIDAGHSLTVSRVKPVSQFLVDKGATAADTPEPQLVVIGRPRSMPASAKSASSASASFSVPSAASRLLAGRFFAPGI